MPSLSVLAVYVPVAVVMACTPGPAILFVLGRASSDGRRAGALSAAGIMSGTLVLITVAAAGLTGILATAPAAFEIVKDAGAVYLVYLGIRTWAAARDGAPGTDARVSGRAPWRLYRDGVVTELLNPKAALFYASVLPQFVEPQRGHVSLQIFILGLVFCAVASVSLGGIVLLAGGLRGRIERRPAWLVVARRASGLLLVGLGAGLAVGRVR